MDTLFTLATLAAAIRLAIPVAVAALGELISERAGVLNLGLEGTMLFGALAGYLATLASGTPWLGLGGGLAAGAACGAVLALLMVVVRADQIVTGLAFTLFAGSATTYLFELSFTIGQAPPRIPSLSMAPLVVIVLVVLAGVWFLLTRTTAGLVLSATGEAPEAVDALGYRIPRVRTLATVTGSALAGLAGAMYLARFGNVDSGTGNGYELTVVSAVVVGGVVFTGGSGSVYGAALGALLLTSINSVLPALGVSSVWVMAINGTLLILAIAVDRIVALRVASALKKRNARHA
jgi:ABC-type uncharacterized transport system permease subunit